MTEYQIPYEDFSENDLDEITSSLENGVKAEAQTDYLLIEGDESDIKEKLPEDFLEILDEYRIEE